MVIPADIPSGVVGLQLVRGEAQVGRTGSRVAEAARAQVDAMQPSQVLHFPAGCNTSQHAMLLIRQEQLISVSLLIQFQICP